MSTLNNATTKQFQITQFGHLKWGIQYLPSDFNTSTKKYSLLVFFHGDGETGTTEASLDKLFVHGPAAFIKAGNKLEFVNPNTNITESFIFIALQDPYSSPDINQVFYAIKNDPQIKDRISNIFYTGVSAGGQASMMGVLTNQVMATSITAIVPMSSAGWDKNGVPFAIKANVKSWGFHAQKDPTCPWETTRDFTAALGTNARATYTPDAVHDMPWNKYYDPNYRELIDGKSVNIYEWMLSKISNTIIVPPPTGPKAVFTWQDITANKTITLFDNNTWS